MRAFKKRKLVVAVPVWLLETLATEAYYQPGYFSLGTVPQCAVVDIDKACAEQRHAFALIGRKCPLDDFVALQSVAKECAHWKSLAAACHVHWDAMWNCVGCELTVPDGDKEPPYWPIVHLKSKSEMKGHLYRILYGMPGHEVCPDTGQPLVNTGGDSCMIELGIKVCVNNDPAIGGDAEQKQGAKDVGTDDDHGDKDTGTDDDEREKYVGTDDDEESIG